MTSRLIARAPAARKRATPAAKGRAITCPAPAEAANSRAGGKTMSVQKAKSVRAKGQGAALRARGHPGDLARQPPRRTSQDLRRPGRRRLPDDHLLRARRRVAVALARGAARERRRRPRLT